MSNSDEIRWRQRLENFSKAIALLSEALDAKPIDEYSRLEPDRPHDFTLMPKTFISRLPLPVLRFIVIFARLDKGSWRPRQSQQPFTAPDAHNANLARIVPIDDTKRRLDQLPQKRLVELRHDSTQLRMRSERLDPPEDLGDQPFTDLGNTLLDIPEPDLLQIGNR